MYELDGGEPEGAVGVLSRAKHFSGKVFFQTIAKFFSQQPEITEINNFVVFVKQKIEFIPFSKMKCPKFGLFTIGWG